MGDNLSCECFVPDLRLRSWHFPNQHTQGNSILPPRDKLMWDLIRKVVVHHEQYDVEQKGETIFEMFNGRVCEAPCDLWCSGLSSGF